MELLSQSFCNNTLHELFEERANKCPDNVAVTYEEINLTYAYLNERANKLAHYLHYKIKPDTLVGLCMNRSEELLIAILAVLKAGGAYVPIDPRYPDKRIHYIIKDINTKLVLTDRINKGRLEHIIQDNFNTLINKAKNYQIEIIDIQDKALKNRLSFQSKTNLKTQVLSINLAYVIYTSGTTGNPKGVMVEHKSIVSRIVYLINKHQINSRFKIAAKTPYSFDPSLREIFLALLAGAQLIIIPEELYKDIDKTLNYCIRVRIYLLILIPSQLAVFFVSIKELPIYRLSMFKIIYFCGEPLPKKLALALKNYLPNVVIKNQYGPTECCLFSFEFDISSYVTNAHGNIPVGKAVDHMKGYILNDNLIALPIGAIGELYIGGIGLARGYLNLPELTAEKFIPNPFRTAEEKLIGKNERLYKTGDLVRWLPDGNLEYIGRNDFQIKIRGYRIELGEIESVLLGYNGIRQSAVLAKQHKDMEGEVTENKYLVSYYVSDSKLDEDDILNYLRNRLPEYMIPNRLVHLKNLPLTINGKLDRKTLPDPEFNDIDYVAPRDQLEHQICQIWAEVLGVAVDKIGIHDNFFKLGGNSILAIRLISKLNKKLNKYIHIPVIFKENTIVKLIKYLEVESVTLSISTERWVI